MSEIPEYRKVQNMQNPSSSRFHAGPQEDEEDRVASYEAPEMHPFVQWLRNRPEAKIALVTVSDAQHLCCA